MIRFVCAVLIALGLMASSAFAAHLGNRIVAPYLQNITVNFGRLTVANKGGVFADKLLQADTLNNPVASYSVSTNDTHGYWATRCGDGSWTSLPTNGTPTVVSNDCALGTLRHFVADGGFNYTVGDVLPMSNGVCLTVSGTTTDNNSDASGVISAFTFTGTPTQSAEGVGNTVIAASFAGCTYTVANPGASGFTATWVYIGQAQIAAPSTAGAAAGLGYVNTPVGCGGVTNPCKSDMAKATLSVTPTGANGMVGNTVTITINVFPDGGNTSDNNYLTANLFFQANSSVFGAPGQSSTLQNFRAAMLNCSTGASSACDATLAISTGATMSNQNVGPCCGVPYQMPWSNVNYDAATTIAGGTPSVTDSLTVEDAARVTGNAMIAATANHPAVNELDPNAGGTLGPATIDRITMSSSLTTTATSCNTSSTSIGMSGIEWVGLNVGGAPSLNYAVNSVYGILPQQACHMWFTDTYFYSPYTFDATGNISSYLAGGYYIGFEVGGALNHIYIDDTFYDGIGNCLADGITSSSGAAVVGVDVQVRDSTCAHYIVNALAPSVTPLQIVRWNNIDINSADSLILHPDDVQVNDAQGAAVGLLIKEIATYAANATSQSDGLFMGNCTLATVPQNRTIQGVIWTGNANGGVEQQCGDSTNGISSIQDGTYVPNYPNYPASTGGNPVWNVLTTNATNPTDGQVINIGLGCPALTDPGCRAVIATGTISGTTMTITAITSGVFVPSQLVSGSGITGSPYIVSQLTGTTGGIGAYQLSASETVSSAETIDAGEQVFTVTMKNTVSDNTHQVQIGATFQATMVNLATAWGISPQQGNCGGVAPTVMSAAYTAAQIAIGLSPVRICMTYPTGGISHILVDSAPVNGLIFFPMLSCPFTVGNADCTGTACLSGGCWFETQFFYSQNSFVDNNPLLQNSGQYFPQGPTLELANTFKTGATCSGTVNYCPNSGPDLFLIDKNFFWDGVQGNSTLTQSTTWFSTAAAITGLGLGGAFDMTTNNFIAGNDSNSFQPIASTGNSYNSTTGAAQITLQNAPQYLYTRYPGNKLLIPSTGLAGTGDYTAFQGSWTITSIVGNVISFNIGTGHGAITLTAGNVGNQAGTSTGIFVNDNGTTAPARFAAILPTTWTHMNAYQVCQTYAGTPGTQIINGVSVPTGILDPQPGGPLDPLGNETIAIGGITFDAIPKWNTGTGDIVCGMNDNYYPYYHLTLAGG